MATAASRMTAARRVRGDLERQQVQLPERGLVDHAVHGVPLGL
jgi:hypothetical protein